MKVKCQNHHFVPMITHVKCLDNFDFAYHQNKTKFTIKQHNNITCIYVFQVSSLSNVKIERKRKKNYVRAYLFKRSVPDVKCELTKQNDVVPMLKDTPTAPLFPKKYN